MNELELIVCILSNSTELESCLKNVKIKKGISCSFFTCNNVQNPNFKDANIIITGDVSFLLQAYAVKKENVSMIYYGNEVELLQCDSIISDSLESVWTKPVSAVILQHNFSKLVEKLKFMHDAWLYRSLLTTTIDSMPEMVWYKNIEGAHLMVNEQFCKTVHKSKEQIAGKGHSYIWDVSETEYEKGEYVCRESDNTVIQKKTTCIFEEAVKTKDGMKQFRTYKSPILGMDGAVIGTVGVAHDITDFSNMGSELSILIENLPFPLAICNKDWDIIRINYNFKEAFGVKDDGIINNDYHSWKESTFKTMHLKKDMGNKSRIVEVVLDGHGQNQIFELTEREIIDSFGHVSGYYCLFTDVTVERLYEEKIIKLANTDPLTQLYNRRYFYNYAKMHENEPLTLFYMDLDNFKPINDTFGHKYGDSVLVAAAEQIKKDFPDGMVARMGGDEFVIVLCGQYDNSDMHKRAAKLMSDIESTFCDNKTFGKITISIGIAQTDGTDKDIDALIAESDAQMYKKKGTHLHIRK